MDLEKTLDDYMKKVGISKNQNIIKKLQSRIIDERDRKSKISIDDMVSRIKDGDYKQSSLDFILLTRPHQFNKLLTQIIKDMDSLYSSSLDSFKFNASLFLINITLNLKSYLPYWNLMNEDINPNSILNESQIDNFIDESRKLLEKWEKKNGDIKKAVLHSLIKITRERLESEDVSKNKINGEAYNSVGKSLKNYIDHMFSFIDMSNLLKISKLRNSGDTTTELGNDYAAHLLEAMWLGASFVTTNPQLAYVNYDRKLDISDTQIDSIISQFLHDHGIKSDKKITQETIEELTDIFTAEVVINNASLLRDVFLLTEGNKGYVCLQVNPLYHRDTEKMVEQALKIFTYLYKRIGGVPNVVFKLPGTKAGLEAQKILTSIGIGANITVEFGLFQIIPFAKTIDTNNTIVSHLTLMNGRLAFPIRDELLSLGVPNAKEAAQWAGVAVGKKAFNLLYSKQHLDLGPSRIKLLIASLRNYSNFFPDITELIGAPIITVFPNIRNQFDSTTCNIDPHAIKKPVDENIIKILSKSEIFKQAYYLPGDPEYLKPKSVLSLDNTEAVINWIPIKATLDAFITARQMTEMELQKRVINILNT